MRPAAVAMGAAFLGTAFVLAPAGAVRLNELCDWPRWHVAILAGLFLHRGELALLLSAAIYAGAVHAWVVVQEEPELRQRFGDAYVRYAHQVPRWIPMRPRARSASPSGLR